MGKNRLNRLAQGEKPQARTERNGDGKEKTVGTLPHIEQQQTVACEKVHDENAVAYGGQSSRVLPQATEKIIDQAAACAQKHGPQKLPALQADGQFHQRRSRLKKPPAFCTSS